MPPPQPTLSTPTTLLPLSPTAHPRILHKRSPIVPSVAILPEMFRTFLGAPGPASCFGVFARGVVDPGPVASVPVPGAGAFVGDLGVSLWALGFAGLGLWRGGGGGSGSGVGVDFGLHVGVDT